MRRNDPPPNRPPVTPEGYGKTDRIRAAAPEPAPPSPAKRRPGNGIRTVRSEVVSEKLSGLNQLVSDWDAIVVYIQKTAAQMAARRRIQNDQLLEPRIDIAVPAIEAIRYSALKKELALLIASTMDPARTHDAHPAFIEFLKQISRDEINLIAHLPPPSHVVPMATLHHLDRAGSIQRSLRHIIPAAYARTCERQASIPGYIDNLLRLNLISNTSQLQITDSNHYRDLLNQDFVQQYRQSVGPQLTPKIVRHVVCLTEFGQQFRSCCIDPPDGAAWR